MTLSASNSYTDLAPAPAASNGTSPLATGLPAFWWPCVWSLGCVLYSASWMAQSWRAAQPLIGATKVNYVAQDLWCLILTLAGSYAVHGFWRHRSGRTGLALGLALLVAMAWQRL